MTKEYDCIFFTDMPDKALTWKTLGAYKLANVLRDLGYSCLVVDHLHCFTNSNIESLLENSVSKKTKFVGFNVGFFANTEGSQPLNPFAKHSVRFGEMNINESFCPQGKEFEDVLIAKVKSLNSNCKIVIGGAQAISHQVSNQNIDYLVVGYAEVSVVNLMRHLEGNETLQKSYKNLNGVILVDDRNASEFDFSKSSMTWLPEDIGNSKVLPLEVSRGCIFNCKFCQYPMRGKKTNEHLRSAESIYHELQRNYDQYGISTYTLVDDTFNDDDEKLDAFLAAVKRLTFQPIFWCYARLDLLVGKPDRMTKLYDIGIRAMFLGIETLHREAGMAVGKGMHSHKQIKTVQDIRNTYGNDVQIHGNFIVGLPGEPLSSTDNTCNLYLTGELPLHTARFTPLKIYNGNSWWKSEIDTHYEKFGYVNDPDQQFSKDMHNALGYNLGSDFLYWKNEHMTFSIAAIKAQEYNLQIQNCKHTHIPNQTMWAMLNYSSCSFDQLKDIKLLDVDWAQLIREKIKTVVTYKQFIYKSLTTQSK